MFLEYTDGGDDDDDDGHDDGGDNDADLIHGSPGSER